MALVELKVHRERSGPQFIERDSETITHVHESEQRRIAVGPNRKLLLTLPSRSSIFVIDADGVTRVDERSRSLGRLMAFALAGLATLALLRRFTHK